MLISGIQPFTMLDFPGKISCVVFTPGCNFRCGYCHNPEFVLPERILQLKNSFIPESVFFSFLEKRRGLLDGVVVSGGEPTLAFDLLRFLREIKARGFLVKLDTNGNRPEVLQRCILEGVVDYIAMDVKTSFKNYQSLVGPLAHPEKIKQSMEVIMSASVDYEFRTTLIKEVHSKAVIGDMVEMLRGAKRFFLQTFRGMVTLNPVFSEYHAFSAEDTAAIAELFRSSAASVFIRG